MSYVLILMLATYGSDGGNALATATFETQAACETAGKLAQEMEGINKRIRYRCAPTR